MSSPARPDASSWLAFRLGRLAERTIASPARAAFELREAAWLAAADSADRGAAVGSLFRAAAGAPPPAHDQRATEVRALTRRWAQVHTAIAGWDARLGDTSLPPAPDLPAASLDELANAAFDAQRGEADRFAVQLGVVTASMRELNVALPCLASGLARPERLPEGRVRARWLSAYRAAVDQDRSHALQRLDALERCVAAWRIALPAARSSSRLAEVLGIVLERPFVTAPIVAGTLSISRQAASAHLARLVDAEILAEAGHRTKGRAFIMADLPSPPPEPVLSRSAEKPIAAKTVPHPDLPAEATSAVVDATERMRLVVEEARSDGGEAPV